MAVAGDVPHKFDCVINGEGYMYADMQDIKAEFTFSPTFLARQNITGNYGDNQQDFWFTSAQRDWSLGEQQKFLRVNDEVSARRFWQGTAIDVRVPGQVTLRQSTRTITFAAQVVVGCYYDQNSIAVASGTNLYTVNAAGTITDLGAHGLGGTPTAICSDSVNIFLSAAGTKIRQWNGAAFSDFTAASAVSSIEYLNNAIYGIAESGSNLTLIRYDTAGAATTIHSWLSGLGGHRATIGGASSKVKAFGGKLLALLALRDGPELWQYDGTGTSILAKLPPNFTASKIEVLHGIVFVAGLFVVKSDGTNDTYRPGIYFYANGQVGLLWQADTTITTSAAGVLPGIAAYDSGLIFSDDTRGQIMYYDIVNGGVHTVCSYTVSGTDSQIIANRRFFIQLRFLADALQYPNASAVATSGTVVSSLMDFDSSLNKSFRSVRVDATIPTGATIDIERQLDSHDGSWTTVQTAAVSGTEYPLSVEGYSVALRFTLNKGSSTLGPTLKRYRVRAAPVQPQFAKRLYVLALGGRDGSQHVQLRNTQLHPKDGLAQLLDLHSAGAVTTPITITDEIETYTGVIIGEESKFQRIRQGEYIAIVSVREV